MIMCQLTDTNGLHLEISFDSKVIDLTQMERIAFQFEHVLRQICTSSTQTVGKIDTASVQDVREVWRWNVSVPSAIQECVNDLIGNTIKRQPQAPAICSWDGNLSYAKLDDLSGRLASHLVALGAGHGTIIPLVFEKSLWYPVAALGVMRAGAACVAMDSTQPEARLRSIVKQVNPKLVLSSATNEALASIISNTDVIVVDRAHILEFPPGSTAVSLPKVRASDVLYVVFTSGSTGVPKGVVTTHENFASAATHQAEILHIKRGTRVFDFVSYNFDVSWSNTLQTLICGGCLCIPSEWERKNDIASSLNRMNCDYVYFTPSVARSLEPSTMPGIRTLAMGGEPIQSTEVSRWTQAETIIGIYGPAECAQALSFARLSANTRNSHVGYSFGARTWLVQPGYPDRLAAIGTIGELLIEGPTVSNGYFGDPEKTTAAYIRDPVWLPRGAPGYSGRHGTLYKTGDLLRYNSDGSLDFIGRKDGMIKLRGQRIELGEVEYHVRSSLHDPSLCDGIAAEIIVPQNSSSPILAVFVSLSKEGGVFESEEDTRSKLVRVMEGLEEKISQRVPQYMIPGAYIHIEKIPMTTTNKTDRQILRELGNAQTLEKLAVLQSHGKDHRAPSTVIERRLQALWSSVLGIEAGSINAESSFLRIGGESIAAMRLVSAAREQQLLLTVADIFKAQNLSQLALSVTEIVAEEESLEPQPRFSLLKTNDPKAFLHDFVEPFLDTNFGNVKDVIPATDFQERAILDALQDPPSRLPHWILDLPADVDFSRLERACEKLVEHFDILHTVFIQANGKFWQVLLSDFKPTYDNFDADDEDVSSFTDAICEQDLKGPRQLGRSFVRFMAVKHRWGKHKLVFRISHAQFDGFSWGLVLQTLSTIYSQERLPTLPSFGQFIALNELKKEESLRYWTSRLQRSSYPSWSLSDSTNCLYNTKDRLTMKETIHMPNTQRPEGVSAATVFHAACAVVLSRQFQQREVVLGRLVTGRSMLPSSLQNVVGPCMTEVPIRLKIDANDTLSSVALQLQNQFIEDSTHEASGMVEIIKNCTDWPNQATDFGWRTAFQQEEDAGFTFLGSPSSISLYESNLLPRTRPEVYATPREGKLDLQFEGNRRLIGEDTVREFLARLQTVLSEY
jgi:amino acid adenylation domain-containing protein